MEIFSNKNTLLSFLKKLPKADKGAANFAKRYLSSLTKPKGSLGRLEDLVVWLAGWQGSKKKLSIDPAYCLIFCGNHGVTEEGVSAYPSEVTMQMVKNFENNGAAINHLCDVARINLIVNPIELDNPTKNIAIENAMNENEVLEAMRLGSNSIPDDAKIILLGEMGIGNTTIASTISAASFGGIAKEWVGPGTGIKEKEIKLKTKIIDKALLNNKKNSDPITLFQKFGGRELAAIVGAVIKCRIKKIPVILDGFVCSASLSPFIKKFPDILEHCQVAHLSSEPGHALLLNYFCIKPILDLKMGLGEGSGAATALPIFRSALAAYNNMATFEGAGVSRKKRLV